MRADVAQDIRTVEQLRVQEAEAVAARLDRLDSERAEQDATIARLKREAKERAPAAVELREAHSEVTRLKHALDQCQSKLETVSAAERQGRQRLESVEAIGAMNETLRDSNAKLQAELAASTAIHRAEFTETIRGSESHRARADALEREIAAIRGAGDRERDQLRFENQRLSAQLVEVTHNLEREKETMSKNRLEVSTLRYEIDSIERKHAGEVLRVQEELMAQARASLVQKSVFLAHFGKTPLLVDRFWSYGRN